jgi:hypothetical protein
MFFRLGLSFGLVLSEIQLLIALSQFLILAMSSLVRSDLFLSGRM